MNHVKQLIVMVVMAAMLVGPLAPAAGASDFLTEINKPSPGYMVADFFAARPLGLVATLFGTATFLLALPFSELGDNTQESFDMLVAPAAKYTFKRPLGDFR